MQRALIQYKDPANYELVKEALIKAHREDLIGTGTECLIRPNGGRRKTSWNNNSRNSKRYPKNSRGKKY